MAIAIVGTDGNPLTSRDIDASPNNFIFVAGRLVFTGVYGTQGVGDLLDWTTVMGVPIPSSICLQLFVESSAGSVNLYSPVGGPATALNNWRIRIYAGSFTELGTGAAYSGTTQPITTDVVGFQAMFRKLL